MKCHNRSARIGLSYFGRYESARYGTPYRGSGFSGHKLSGGRFYLNIAPDIHHEKAGMDCIDCHTATGLMGDGHSYSRLEKQVDITCQACHWPFFRVTGSESKLAYRLSSLNRKVPFAKGAVIGVTKKKTPIYNLQLKNGKILFFRKRDGKAFEISTRWHYTTEHKLAGHERLSCQACHSSWIPQCYGCHTIYNGLEKQRDWLTGKWTKGKWEERRSFMRFERPSLALRFHKEVYPVSPCQVFVYPFEQPGNGKKVKRLRIFTISAFDPHTTRKESRTCEDCHWNPKTIGLGNGILAKRGPNWSFIPIYDSMASGLGVSFPLDGIVDMEGNATHRFSRSGGRAFNGEEIKKILRVGLCTGCHNSYGDKVYENFEKSLVRFRTDQSLPCWK